ncbi:hypothetical protein K435DRAFT_801528 [Dendrothele bispora CBS 962.96]|uniref:Uncharacterized protein n=1 Tax=Dendrothele bispora (strain CBS 962.96) TaxID=1314807 RepID=A0A4S8LQ46_DENBC|nr:hypothetical protein K435DRAFT_801528 [Dendrothele bispora CBS 962.96]
MFKIPLESVPWNTLLAFQLLHNFPTVLMFTLTGCPQVTRIPADLERIVPMTVYYDDDFGIWSLPNISTLFSPVLVYWIKAYYKATIKDYQCPKWLNDFCPQYVFMPMIDGFNSVLFEKLTNI